MSALVFDKAHAPSVGQRLRVRRRVASVFLLLGWFAFWFVATLQPCCKLSVAAAHSVGSSSFNQSAALDHHGDADHHSPASGGTCNDVTIVANVAPATAAEAFSSKPLAQTYPACVIEAGHAVWQATYAAAVEFPSLPPPRPLPFHQRTSRLLI